MSITFKNFTTKQIEQTSGFNRKIEKIASSLGVKQVLYSEIINLNDYSLDVLIIGEDMDFHKVYIYSDNKLKMLNTEFGKLISSLGFTSEDYDSEKITNIELIEAIETLLSNSIEQLSMENTTIDRLENSTSSTFNVSIMNFSYPEIHNALEPLVKNSILKLYNFKVLNLSKHSAEILALTTECKLFQYTIYFDSTYCNFLNRYISSIVDYDDFIQVKKELKNNTTLSDTLSSILSKEILAENFLGFLLSKYQKSTEKEGYENEGLKNVHKFFMDISSNEQEAHNKVRECFSKATEFNQRNS